MLDWIRDSSASGSDLAVLLIIGILIDDRGAVRIKQAELAELANIGRRSLRRSIGRLIEAGELQAVRGVGRTPTEFTITERTQRTSGDESGADASVRSERTLASGRTLASAPTYGGNGEVDTATDGGRGDAGVRSRHSPVTGFGYKQPDARNADGVSDAATPRLYCLDVLKLARPTTIAVLGKLRHYTNQQALGQLKLWRMYATIRAARGGIRKSTAGYVATAIQRGWELPEWFANEVSDSQTPGIRELSRWL